ncbi:MAG: cobyric acid synthase [Synergistaceae bacterium]|nr:cobyric acid synthase [Synergistaceae bacterium]
MNGIMIQGTSSDSGKSFIVTGLCRLFSDMGIKICPFKSQNMSNNAYVTHDNCEISTAQALQAQAARLIPETFMNPILLKPNHDKSSEIILNGRVFNRPAENNYYREFAENQGIQAIRDSLKYIRENFDAIIIEGAGSPAEINLNAHEIVNMRVAREANVPVILVTDVDRGGSLASIVGTLELLGQDRKRVKGIIFNKFRGDINLFNDAVEWTQNYTGVKVLGVLPFMREINLSGEDSLTLQNFRRDKNISRENINIGVINYPGIANFTDFDSFKYESDVNLIYVNNYEDLRDIDALILPGAKNVIAALEWLNESGLDTAIKNFHGFIFGICGGLQILGFLEILPISTSFDYHEKITRQISGFLASNNNIKVSGYEIHFGRTIYNYDNNFSALFITSKNFTLAGTRINDNDSHESITSKKINLSGTRINDNDSLKIMTNKNFTSLGIHGIFNNGLPEGITNKNFTLAGTYIHGIFDNDNFRALWLNNIRLAKNYRARTIINTRSVQDNIFNQIAKLLTQNLDIKFILDLLIHREGTTLQPE